MGILETYRGKVEAVMSQLESLEAEYKNKNKGNVYLRKSIYLKNLLSDYLRKINNIGTDGYVYVTTFTSPVDIGNGISVPKRYKVVYSNINVETIEQLIKGKHPLAYEFKHKPIHFGILKEI